MDTHFANMRSLIQVSLSESYLNEAEIVSEAESCHDAIVKGRTSTDGLLAIWYFRAGKILMHSQTDFLLLRGQQLLSQQRVVCITAGQLRLT